MSQPKRRSRKSKLVPRLTEGGEPEIREVIESEQDDESEPPIKIRNTMTIATQPGPSNCTGPIQFKVDIEVEEWIDDELFIEENFNKMQSEKLSKALDKEITEEADWTNEEYGKFWAEAASDSEQDEQPLNEYEKLIKNQVDPSVLAGPSKERPGSSKNSVDLRTGTSKENRRQSSKGSKNENKPNESQKGSSIGSKKHNNLDESEKAPSKGIEKENKIDESDKTQSMGFTKAPSKMNGTTPVPSVNPPPLKPIRQYKRPGPKSKTIDVSTDGKPSSLTSEEVKTSSDLSIYENTYKWRKNTANADNAPQKQKINIIYSVKAPTIYHIDLSDKSSIDLPPTSLQDQKNTMLDDPTRPRRMTISELDEFARTQVGLEQVRLVQNQEINSKPVSEPEDNGNMVELRQIIITEEAILSDSKLMAMTSIDPTDYFLDIEVRNRMGYTRFVPIEISREDALIDFGLRQWFQWLGTKKAKSTPVTYKCYICNQGWWHLHPFRVHLKKHIMVNVSLEKRDQECNIIAHNGKTNFKTMVSIHGECWKCGREYPHHFVAAYKCQGCQSRLFTCKALAEHEGICLNIWKEQMEQQKTKDIKAYKCKICPQIFFTEELLHSHQYRCHIPRSDYPMWVQLSQCTYCHQNYVYYAFHYCSRRVQKFRCKFCSRHFPSITALKAHMSVIQRNVTCKVCKEAVLTECMMPRHLLVHNKNYVMVYKCLMCVGKNILLDDVTMVTRHAEFVHKTSKYVRSMWCYAQVPLPITLYTLKKVTTRHKPTSMHDKLKESFIKDLLQYDPTKRIKDTEESQDSSEEKDSQDSTELQDSQDTSEAQEAPTIKIENVMESYFEEDSTEFKPNIDIKLEIEDNVDGTEVNPAELMNMTESEFLNVVKKEEPDDDADMDISQSCEQNMDTSITSLVADTSKNVQERDFSEQLQEYLSNRYEEDEEEEIKDNVNICLNCDFEGTRKEFKKHLKKCDSGEIAKREQELKCTKCGKVFTCMRDYVKHLTKHGFIRCQCIECDRVFPNLSSWTLHIKMHVRRTFTIVKLLCNDSKVFRCRFCKEFVERKLFFKHWEAHLEPPQKKKSLKASVDAEVEGSLSPQVLSRIEEIFGMTKSSDIPKDCIICDKSFCRMNEKKRHLVEHLLEDASDQLLAHGGLVCQFCGVKVVKPEEYRRHMRDHANLTMYHCEFCNKNFSDSSNFVKHKKVHDVDTVTCDVCNRKFLSKASLEAHIATHRPEPLHCARCPTKEFYSESAYNRHVRSYHDRASQFKCQYCRAPFPSLREKWDHLWEAHQVRSQIADCPMCDKKFRKSQDVRAHILNDHHMKKVFSYVPVEETASDSQ